MWRQASLTSSEDTNLGLPAEEHVNFIYSSRSEFSICRSFTFSRSTNLRMRFFFFEFWVTQSPLKLAYICVHRHRHIHTCAHLIATYTIDCASHWETCIHRTYLSNLSCIFLNSTDHWVDTFCVAKFFHEHFCFTFSYDVFLLFWPPEMTVLLIIVLLIIMNLFKFLKVYFKIDIYILLFLSIFSLVFCYISFFLISVNFSFHPLLIIKLK